MAIELYEHNRTAYKNVASMLQSCGKAAVVHPTGTGKTYIAFKLCEDNPDKKILWLSPSEYIFKTQLENVKKQGGNPKNIQFYTYAKLTYLTDEEIEEIAPEYIVMDEFHRAGAAEWGKRVSFLLNYYAGVPVLGLSATNIRYLDNQRDMAEELFDGCIASKMTLGEAIVRGILNPPTYIAAIYSCKDELRKYERHVKALKSRAARDVAEEYLQRLRRAADKADGLDAIFGKYIKEKNGKYLIFCPDAESMDKLIEKSDEMFGGIDGEKRIYRVYSEDPETDRAFQAFKKDESAHLKLLYCIDMLNEGIHVADVDGVILFRPTISPIIYKQQIGRAMSAGKAKNPVIFDIVNNFENLYSIGSIEEEMNEAIGYYRSTGENAKIVNERFTLIDEAKDCRRLFEELEESLTASWDTMYSYAKAYYKEFGNLDVPKRYKTEEGYSLGMWIVTQRRVRSGEQYGKLDEERIEKLDRIGMVWDNVRDLSWEKHYTEAKLYFKRNGDLNVSAKYVTESGFALGSWITNLRQKKAGGAGVGLTADRISMLDGIGMIWDKNDMLFERNFAAAKAYSEKYGNLDVPCGYKTADGIAVGTWVRYLRRQKDTLDKEKQLRLEALGMEWRDKYTLNWEQGIAELKRYVEEKGNAEVPVTYVSDSGFKLGVWLARKRSDGKGRLNEERKRELSRLGVKFEREDPWDVRYELAEKYYSEHGNLNVPAEYRPKGIWLNKWLNEQRQIYNGNRNGKKLTEEQIEKLERIGMRWKKEAKRTIEEKVNDSVLLTRPC